MKYVLIQIVLARNVEILIDKKRYDQISKSRFDLTDFTAIEEKFDIALENHYEFEKEINSIASRDMMFSEITEIYLWRTGNLLNRRVANVLASCRAYLDHTAHHLSNIYGKTSQISDAFKAIKSKQYDGNHEYRIAEAMRNYGQHRGFPMHDWSLGIQKVGSHEEIEYEYRVGLKIVAKNLRDDGDFKAKALHDIDDLGGSADLLALIRGYIESLSDIHCDLREATKPRVDEIEQILLAAVNEYEIASDPNETFPGLAVAVIDENNCATERHYIVPSALEFRRSFLKKNIRLRNFKKSYVSSRTARSHEGS